MSDDPVFVYAAVYADRADADADYDALLELHSADLVGSYDVALMYKDDKGKVHVTKHRSPPSTAPGRALRSARWWGSSFRRRSSVRRSSAPLRAAGSDVIGGICAVTQGLGEQLDEGQAALVVIGKSRVQEQLDKALTRAEKSEEREIEADGKELAEELDALPQ